MAQLIYTRHCPNLALKRCSLLNEECNRSELIKTATRLVRETQNSAQVLAEETLSCLEAQVADWGKCSHHQPKHLLHLHFSVYCAGRGILDRARSLPSTKEGKTWRLWQALRNGEKHFCQPEMPLPCRVKLLNMLKSCYLDMLLFK